MQFSRSFYLIELLCWWRDVGIRAGFSTARRVWVCVIGNRPPNKQRAKIIVLLFRQMFVVWSFVPSFCLRNVRRQRDRIIFHLNLCHSHERYGLAARINIYCLFSLRYWWWAVWAQSINGLHWLYICVKLLLDGFDSTSFIFEFTTTIALRSMCSRFIWKQIWNSIRAKS